jgi:hypothetical protein
VSEQRASIATPAALVLTGAALVIVGAFLPWVSAATLFGTLGRNGLESGGWGFITLVLGITAGLVGWRMQTMTAAYFWKLCLACAVVVGGIVIWLASIVNEQLAETSGASLGTGLWLTGLGAFFIAVGALRERRQQVELD